MKVLYVILLDAMMSTTKWRKVKHLQDRNQSGYFQAKHLQSLFMGHLMIDLQIKQKYVIFREDSDVT